MIYDEDKMNQKPVYPTKRTPSYADWSLFDMGADLEQAVNVITEDISKIPTIPTPTIADAGEYIKVDAEGAYELATIPVVPTPEVADEGKILTVNNAGAYALAMHYNKTAVSVITDLYANDIFIGTLVDTNTYKGVFLATVLEGDVTLSPIVVYDTTSQAMQTADITITVASFAGTITGYKI